VLRPDTDIEITHTAEVAISGREGHLPERDRRRDRTAALHPGDSRGGLRPPGLVRRAHTGSVHLYLAYGALGVLVVLVVAGERDVLRRWRAQIGRSWLGAPVVIGAMRQVRARLEGAPVAACCKPWRDIIKQLGKTTDHAAGNDGGVRGRPGDRRRDDAA